MMLSELKKKNSILYYSGWVHVIMAVVCLALMPFDDRVILGLSPWIKPFKFSASIALFLWTFAWLMDGLKDCAKSVRWVSWGFSLFMLLEILAIFSQSWRGVTSHFNRQTLYDGVVFGLMGIAILANTLFVGYVLYLFFKMKTRYSLLYVWSIRLGIAIFLLGSIEGGLMVSLMKHTVGLADGGPGLPLLNWSTRAGDLRISHFLGLHAIQVIPFVGYWLGKRSMPLFTVYAFSFCYLGAMVYLLVQALMGIPFISLV